MVKAGGDRRMLAAVLAGAVLIIAAGTVIARTKSIKYLPQDHSMEMIKKDYSPAYTVGEVDCSSAPLAREYFTCQKCITLRQRCKDCCFLNNDPTTEKLRCTPDDTQDYRDTSPGLPFATDDDSCPQAECTETACQSGNPPATDCPDQLNHYQPNGCPSTTRPAGGECSKGTGVNSAYWYCNKGNLSAQSSCPMRSNFTGQGLECGSIHPKYSSREELEKPKMVGLNKIPSQEWKDNCEDDWNECFRYEPNQDFADCVADCTDKAKERENCAAKTQCCWDNACPGETPSGFALNCPLVKANNCYDRINYRCDTEYAPAPCSQIIKEYNDWLLSGRAAECFRPIDPTRDFKYRFVARSSEKLTVTWQVLCSAVQTSSDRMFYTMVKVLDESGDEVYHSVIHQRSFQNKFFISAATSVPPDLLVPGNAYTAEIFYYIPWIGTETLEMTIEYLQLILHRSRE